MKYLPWKLVCAGMILIVILTYTPLVIPAGEYQPQAGSLPYSLWIGLLLVALMVILTFIGTRVHPVNEEEEVL